ncbi:MAG: protoporphyrinogen oxidase, partial [Verrucomicrobiota bacterium]
FPKLHALEQKYGSLILGQFLGARARKRSGEVSKQNAPKFSFDEGLQVLTEELRVKLGDAIELDSPVTAITQTAEGWTVNYRSNAQELQREHEAVLFTSPIYKLADMKLETADKFDLSPLEKIEYPPVASIIFGFRRADVEHACQGFGALIPEVERFNILGVIFSSALFPNRAPKDHLTITCYVGGSRNPELARTDRSTLRRVVLEDLKRLLGVRGEPIFEHFFVYPKAIPQYQVGFGKMKTLMDEIETKARGFFMAGHFRDGIALGDSILSGDHAAEKISTYLFEHHISQKLNHIATA